MSRIIKFRGKTLTEEWIYGSLIQSGYEFEDESHIFSWRTNKDILVKEETIGQFTGVHDKNGKEIYEGDIFQVDDYTNGVVIYLNGEGSYGIKCKDGEGEWVEPFSYYNFSEMELLGNEYDNPELLGE